MNTQGEKLRAASNHTGSCFYFKPGILKPNARYKLTEVEETDEAYIFTLEIAPDGLKPSPRRRPKNGTHQCDNLQYQRLGPHPSLAARFGASPATFTGNKVTVLKKAAKGVNLRTHNVEQASKQQKELHLKPSKFKPVGEPIVPNGFIDASDLSALVRAVNDQKDTNPELSLGIREDGRLRITREY